MVTLSSSSNHASQPEPTRRVYLDLDGVMADFDAHFPATFGVDHRGLADDAMWETINAHPSYFRDMPPCAGAVEFFRSIEHLRPIILTACPKTNYPDVARQKRGWVREHLSEHVTVLPVMGGRHKPLFMQEPGDILIDDLRKNIEAWNEAEGVGILHRSFEGTAAALRTALATTNAVPPQAVDVTGEVRELAYKTTKRLEISSSDRTCGIIAAAIMAGPATRPAASGAVAWMNADHLAAYKNGTKDGIAWASPAQSEFYSEPLFESARAAEAALASMTAERDNIRKDAYALGDEVAMLEGALHDLLTRPTDPASRIRAREALARSPRAALATPQADAGERG